jgi:hypothetical protein
MDGRAIVNHSQPVLEICIGRDMGLLHSQPHDPWAGGGTVGWESVATHPTGLGADSGCVYGAGEG